MIGKALLVWLGLLGLAILTGAVRDKLLRPVLGPALSHIVGTLLFCFEILLVAALFVVRLEITQTADLWTIGIMWTVLTVVFEFGFFRYVMKKPWEELLADYNILKGRIWVLVLVTTLLAPAFVSWVLEGVG